MAASAKNTESKVIEYNGVEYELPADAMDNIELLEYIEDEKYTKAVRAIITPAQWNKFKDSNRDESGKVPMDAFQPFIEKLFADLGN